MKQKHATATVDWQVAEGAGYRYRLGKHGDRFARAYSFEGKRYQKGTGMEHIHDHDAAALFIEEELIDLRRKTKLPPSEVLLLDVIREWQTQEKCGRRAGQLTQVIHYFENVVDQPKVTLQEAAEWQWLGRLYTAYERGDTRVTGEGPPAPSQRSKFHTAMNHMYGYAQINYSHSILHNPARMIPEQLIPKGGGARIEHSIIPSVAEVDEALVKARKHCPAHCRIIATMVYLNKRRGETLGLKLDDIDADVTTLRFDGQWTQNSRNVWEYVPYLKNQGHLPEHKRRTVVEEIPPKLRPFIVEAIEIARERKSEYLFPNLTGERPNHNGLARSLRRLGTEHLGFDRFSNHDLRYTGISLLAPHDDSADQKVLQDAGNHADRRTTEGYVIDLRAEREKRAGVQKLREAAGLGY